MRCFQYFNLIFCLHQIRYTNHNKTKSVHVFYTVSTFFISALTLLFSPLSTNGPYQAFRPSDTDNNFLA